MEIFPTKIILYFHPKETQFISSIKSTEKNVPYITYGTEIRNDIHYNVMTISFYYKENIAEGFGWTLNPQSTNLGYHENDIEYISIYATNNKIEKVYFSAHSNGQGNWVNWNDCKFSPNNELIIYIALNSHACYNEEGTHLRIFGFANDYCSSKGNKVSYDIHDAITSYDYAFPNGIRLYKNLRPSPKDVTLTKWQKFFLPFYI